MAMVDCKLIRSLYRDENGDFKFSDTIELPCIEVVREGIKVSQATIDETQANSPYTGFAYVSIEPEIEP